MDGLKSRWADVVGRMGLGPVSGRVVVLVAGVAATCVIGALWSSGGGAQEFEIVSDVTPAGVAAGEESVTESAEATLVVHVAGSVLRPGIVHLADGSRVGDAVAAAGGALSSAQLGAVNLARRLLDGEQVYIPSLDEAAAGAGVPTAGTGAGLVATAPLIDLNNADAAALDTLPGVGPSTAAKIIADREANGPFASIDDLQRVSGIGPKRIEEMRPLVEVR